MNESDLVTKICEEKCKVEVQAEKRSQLKCGLSAKFFTVVMSRVIKENGRFEVKRNRVISSNEFFVRYVIRYNNALTKFLLLKGFK